MTLTLQLHVLSDAEAMAKVKSFELVTQSEYNFCWLNAIYKLKCSMTAAHYGVEIVSKIDG